MNGETVKCNAQSMRSNPCTIIHYCTLPKTPEHLIHECEHTKWLNQDHPDYEKALEVVVNGTTP